MNSTINEERQVKNKKILCSEEVFRESKASYFSLMNAISVSLYSEESHTRSFFDNIGQDANLEKDEAVDPCFFLKFPIPRESHHPSPMPKPFPNILKRF